MSIDIGTVREVDLEAWYRPEGVDPILIEAHAEVEGSISTKKASTLGLQVATGDLARVVVSVSAGCHIPPACQFAIVLRAYEGVPPSRISPRHQSQFPVTPSSVGAMAVHSCDRAPA